MVRVYISYANVDTEWQYRIGTLAGTNAIGERDTFSVTVFSEAGADVPIVGQPIRICDDTLGNLYGGTINEVAASFFQGSGAIDLALTCSSWDQLCDRHGVEAQQDYTATKAGDVIKAVFALTTIRGEGVYMTGVADGPTITASFTFQTIASVLDSIVAQCPGYYWKIDADKVLHFALLSATSAPFNLSANDDHLLGPPTITWSREKYANRFIGVLEKYISDAQAETLQGDGSSQIFNTSAPLAAAPTISVCTSIKTLTPGVDPPFTADGLRSDYYLSGILYGITSITLDGAPQTFDVYPLTSSDWMWTPGSSALQQNTPTAGVVVVNYSLWDGTYALGPPSLQTVGASGTTGSQWYWTLDSTEIDQDAGGTPLTALQSLVVNFQTTGVQVVYKSNTDEISARAVIEGGSGVYTEFWTYSDQIAWTAADAMAQGYVDTFASIPLVLEVPTRYIGLVAGQGISLTISNVILVDGSYPLINTAFIVQSVSLQDVNGDLRWNIRAVNGALIPYGYQAIAQMITGQTGTAITGGVGVVVGASVTPPTLPTLPAAITMEEVGSRVLVPPLNRTQATMQVSWTSPGTGVEPVSARYALNVPSGTDGAAGDVPVQTSGTTRYIQFAAWAPTGNQAWSVTVSLETAAASSASITSASTTIYGIGSAAANNVFGVSIGSPVYVADADGHWFFSFVVAAQNNEADPNFFTSKITGQWGQIVGGVWTPASDEPTSAANKAGLEFQGATYGVTWGGWPVYADAAHSVLRIQAWSQSRSQAAAAQWTLQSTACGGGSTDHVDITPTVQAGAIPATRIDASTLGGTLSQNPTTHKLGVAPTSLTQGAIYPGALSDPNGGAWNSVGAPVIVYYGQPAYSSYGTGQLLFDGFDGKIYRNSGYPNGWVKSADPADIIAGTIAAGVAILGTVQAAKIQAGTISAAVALTSPTIQVTSGTVVVNIDGTNYVKVSDSDSTYPRTVQVTNVSAGASGSGASGQMAQAFVRIPRATNAPGEVFLQDAGGTHSLRLIPSSVAGATPPSSTAGFLVFNKDGSEYWIPFYSAF